MTNRIETTRDELIANGSWKPVPRTGVTDAGVKVREMHDSCSGETWFVAVLSRKPAAWMPTEILTTPEEDFGTGRDGSGEARVSATTTHDLLTDDDGVIPVRREEGHEGGWILYTRIEWDGGSQADWEQRPDGVVTFQGKPTGATLRKHK
jgi:hypothetical protein